MAANLIDLDVVARLRDVVGGVAVAEIVSLYAEESSRLLDELEEALATGDVPAVVQRSHTLGTSSATVGAAALAARCRELERSARTGVLPGGGEASEALRALHAESLAALAGLGDRPT